MGLDQWIEDENGKELVVWRKANQVNRFFNENVGFVENCERLEVSKEQLEQLKETCKLVLDNPELADEKLPTGSGFFFGSIEYDEWYFDELKETIKKIDSILADYEEDDGKLYYVAWW